MLNRLDDYPIHQTVEPIAHPATTDRNCYDRSWFNGFSIDGEWYFGIAMGLYPHRGIMDCAFSVVRKGGLQHSFFASRRAPRERTDLTVGPFRIELPEPMRRTRVVLEDNESGLSCDLTFSARTSAIQEGRQTLWNGARKTMDTTRFDLFGRWSGTIRTPDGEIVVSEDQCLGVKDRSWGVRRLGEAETGGAPPLATGGAFFLWAPLFWGDHVTQAIFYDDIHGKPLIREGIVAPFYDTEPQGADVEEGRDRRLATARHRIAYHPGTRLAASAEVDLVDHDDSVRTISFEPLLTFQMKGIGYMHPEWGHGVWKGDLVVAGESWKSDDLDPLAPFNLHIQQVVRARMGDKTGVGVVEQLCLGPHAPSGFVEFLDGAR
jgi:hypothetical protein